jgi:hypothetical protein
MHRPSSWPLLQFAAHGEDPDDVLCGNIEFPARHVANSVYMAQRQHALLQNGSFASDLRTLINASYCNLMLTTSDTCDILALEFAHAHPEVFAVRIVVTQNVSVLTRLCTARPCYQATVDLTVPQAEDEGVEADGLAAPYALVVGINENRYTWATHPHPTARAPCLPTKNDDEDADSPQQAPPAVFGLNASHLLVVRALIAAGTVPERLKPALANLRRRADAALRFKGHGSGNFGCPEDGPWSVVNKPMTPPSGDKHDFTYVSTYAWPCNALCNETTFTPEHCKDWWRPPHGHNTSSAPFPDWSKCDNITGMPWVGHDGFGQKRGQHDPQCSVLMSDTVETLATTYFLTGNESYAEGAAAVFRTWFITPDTAMNPNMKFGGFEPGVNKGMGKPSGIIVTTCRWTTKVTDAAALLRGSKHWTENDRGVFDAWGAAYLAWLLGSSPIARGEFNSTNNHFSWLEVETLALALSTGNASAASMLAERARSKTFRGCLQNQIAPDGLMKIEATREAGASYSTMNLHALFTLATVASHVTSSGEAPLPSLWTWRDSDGRGSIKAALDYLLPFATNQTHWPWKQDGISTWAKLPWGGLAPQLRIAATVYGDAKYEAAIAKLPLADKQWAADVTQLLWPLPPTLELKSDGDDAEAGTCRSDLDCQLNGACRAGVCQCDTQWSAAPDCSRMKILPSKGRGEAYARLGGQNTGWDGTSVYDPVGKLWHIFVGETLACGINSWRSGNGRCIRATSADPQGPYELAEVLQDGFCCCTQVARIPPVGGQGNASWVFSHMGDGTCTSEILNCKDGITPKNRTTGPGNCAGSRRPWAGVKGALSASGPEGPWAPWHPTGTPHNPPMSGGDDNSAGLRALPNGTVFAFSGGSTAKAISNGSETPNPLPAGAPNLCRVIQLSRAETLQSPFAKLPGKPTASSWCSVEAPEFWVDKRGYYHALFEVNGKDGAAAPGPCKQCTPPRPGGTPQILPGNTTTAGQHMYSLNGVDWVVSPVVAYDAVIEFDDNTSLSFARLEDPKLMFDECDSIVGITNPAQLSTTSDHSYVLMQPVAHNPCTPDRVVWKSDEGQERGLHSTGGAKRDCHSDSAIQTVPWAANWNLTESRFAYIANYKPTINRNQSYISLDSPMGLVGLDWTVSVNAWFKPGAGESTCEAVSRENCRRMKTSGTLRRCCIYHNTELALGWLESQRAAMDDESKRDFFLQYKNGTIYSEDIELGRQWFWNHSNAAAAEFFVSSVVSSLTVDDAADCTFTDDTCGLPEEHPEVAERIGMSPPELSALQKATAHSLSILGAALAKAGKWLGSAGGSITGGMRGTAPFGKSGCTEFMDTYCDAGKQNETMTLSADWGHTSPGASLSLSAHHSPLNDRAQIYIRS